MVVRQSEMIFYILFLLCYTWGHDGFGYRYIDSREPDGPLFEWIDHTEGTLIPLGDDANSGLLDILPGAFWFYGTEYTKIAICSNGWASFTSTGNFHPTQSIPEPPGFVNIIAPFAGDLVPDGNIYWDTVGTKLVIGWDSIAPLVGGGIFYTFQMILDGSDSSITFQYLEHIGAGNPWASDFFLTGIGAEDPLHGLQYSSRDREDSLAIRFYYSPLEGISEDEKPVIFSLGRISPNPTNRPFYISYGVEERSVVRIGVYDLLGRKVRDIVNGERSPGIYSVFWDLMDEMGRRVASGVYFVRLSSGDRVASKKFLILGS